jgi:IPT/TIG domain
MITFREVQESPTGWEDETMSFESELTDLVYSYRNKVNKHYVSKTLNGAAEICEKDEGWIYDETNIQPEPGEPATLTALSPQTAVVGDADLTMTATGTGFTADSVIVFNGGEEQTTFVSETELTTGVKPSLASGAGDVPVLVRTAAGDTAPLNFTFTAAGG